MSLRILHVQWDSVHQREHFRELCSPHDGHHNRQGRVVQVTSHTCTTPTVWHPKLSSEAVWVWRSYSHRNPYVTVSSERLQVNESQAEDFLTASQNLETKTCLKLLPQSRALSRMFLTQGVYSSAEQALVRQGCNVQQCVWVRGKEWPVNAGCRHGETVKWCSLKMFS